MYSQKLNCGQTFKTVGRCWCCQLVIFLKCWHYLLPYCFCKFHTSSKCVSVSAPDDQQVLQERQAASNKMSPPKGLKVNENVTVFTTDWSCHSRAKLTYLFFICFWVFFYKQLLTTTAVWNLKFKNECHTCTAEELEMNPRPLKNTAKDLSFALKLIRKMHFVLTI